MPINEERRPNPTLGPDGYDYYTTDCTCGHVAHEGVPCPGGFYEHGPHSTGCICQHYAPRGWVAV